MCVTFFGFHIPINKQKNEDDSETLRLFITFNRDEMTTRKAIKAKRYGDVIHGLDEDTKSTWLAINTVTNRVAFLTNFRHPSNFDKKGCLSRGRLIMDWVYIDGESNDEAEKSYVEENFDKIEKYRGFNLVYGKIGETTDDTNFYYISNYSKDIVESRVPLKLECGRLYGLCNGLIEDWVKVKQGKIKVQSFLDQFDDIAWTPTDKEENIDKTDTAVDNCYDEKFKTFASEITTHFLESQEGQYIIIYCSLYLLNYCTFGIVQKQVFQ